MLYLTLISATASMGPTTGSAPTLASPSFDAAMCPQPTPPKWQFDGPLACPDPELLTGGSAGLTDVQELMPGCPVDVELGLWDQRFFKVNRSSLDSTFHFRWGMQDKSFLTLFAWNAVPSLQGQNHEAYHLPLDQVGTKPYPAAQSAQDFYHVGRNGIGHCGAGDTSNPDAPPTPCAGPIADEHSGYLYIAVVGFGFPAGERHIGRVSFDFLSTPDLIEPTHLNALRDLHATACTPTLSQRPPVFDDASGAHWERHEHVRGHYSGVRPDPEFPFLANFSTSGAERDPDRIDFCDWAYGVDLATATCKTLGDHGVTCDGDGNVVGLNLAHKGLHGPLPPSFANLEALATLDLSFNRLSGALPAGLLSHPRLLALDVRQNQFDGEIPCPAAAPAPTPALTRLFLSDNRFTGALPSCLFERLPLLERARFDDLVELTPGPLPATVRLATRLVVLTANNARRTGEVPRELGCLPQLSTLNLGSNELSGALAQDVIDRLVRLYELDLSFNRLSGAVPVFGESHDTIRLLRLNNNRFSGPLTEQLKAFGRHMDYRARSLLNLANNRFTGPLPETFRAILTDANPVGELYVDGNHFRCDGATGAFPLWANRMHRISNAGTLGAFAAPRFGKCARLPSVGSASNPKIGQQMTVRGAHFEASDELRCKLGGHAFPAAWVSPTEVLCTIPSGLSLTPGETVPLTVANFGEDFAEAPIPITLDLSPPPPSPSAPPPSPAAPPSAPPPPSVPPPSPAAPPSAPPPPSPPPPSPAAPPSPPKPPPQTLNEQLATTEGTVSRNVAATAGAAVAGFVLFVLAGFAFVVVRERQGKPIFAPVLKELGVIEVQAKIAPTAFKQAMTPKKTSTLTSVASSVSDNVAEVSASVA